MTTPSKTKSRFERLLSEIYASRFCKNNQELSCVQIVSNQDQIKISLSVTNFVALTSLCSIIEIFHL